MLDTLHLDHGGLIFSMADLLLSNFAAGQLLFKTEKKLNAFIPLAQKSVAPPC